MSWIRTVAVRLVPFRRIERYRVPLAEFTTRANRTDVRGAERRTRDDDTCTLPAARARTVCCDGVVFPGVVGDGSAGVAPGVRVGAPGSIGSSDGLPNGIFTSRRMPSAVKSPMMLISLPWLSWISTAALP